MSKALIKKIFIVYFAAVAAIVILQLAYYANIHFEKITNHQQVELILNKDLKYKWDTRDEELAEIEELLAKGSLTNEDFGRLYERAAMIHYSNNNNMTYFKYMGYALYYLDHSNEKDYTINIYLDLANFFLNNYANDQAEKMLEFAQSVRSFDEIENPQIKSYAYRMLGITSILNLEYNEAETYFNNSLRVISESHTNTFEDDYTAIDEIWLARVYEETGRVPKCAEILAKWSNSEMFTSDVYRNIYLRDFIIPYYQAKCYYLCADNIKERSSYSQAEADARTQSVIDYLREFMTVCEENNYEKAELYTLLKIQKEYPTKNQKIQKELYTVLNELYANIFTQQNATYASVIDNLIFNSKNELDINAKILDKSVRRAEFILVVVVVFAFIIIIFVILILNNRFDGLTKLLNRKVFDKDVARLGRSTSEYGVIMIDIDDFKQVNDTYGHPEGDVVIRRLGELIEKETTSDIRGYRYGGEEFAIIVGKNAIQYVGKIAERTRDYMQQQGWEFNKDLVITLSIGTATGKGYDVVKQADDNLYMSKQNGKNQVTST